MHATLYRIALLIMPLITSAVDLPAQSPPASDSVHQVPSEWLVGGSIGFPGYGLQTSPTMFTVGAHWTQAHVGRLGADFAVGSVPWALANGFAAVGARGGVTVPLPLSERVLLLPSAGVSVLGAVGSGGGVGTTGFNAGIAAMFLKDSGAGLRTGVTWHILHDGASALWLWEVGFVRRPRRR